MRAYGSYGYRSRPLGWGPYRPQEHVPMFPPPPPPPEMPRGQQVVLLRLRVSHHKCEVAKAVLAHMGEPQPDKADWRACIVDGLVGRLRADGPLRLLPRGDNNARELALKYAAANNIHVTYYTYHADGVQSGIKCSCGQFSTYLSGRHRFMQMMFAESEHIREVESGEIGVPSPRAKAVYAAFQARMRGEAS